MGYANEKAAGIGYIRIDGPGCRIFCDVNLDMYPGFADLNLGQKVIFVGKIGQVQPDIDAILLSDCKIDFSEAATMGKREAVLNSSTRSLFEEMYDKARVKLGIKNSTEFDKWLMQHKQLQDVKCPASPRGKKETIIGHIRNCIHYSEHGTCSQEDLSNALVILKEILR